MRSTAKEVISKLQAHILDSFTPEDFDTETPEQALASQIAYMRHGSNTNYQTALDLVDGGTFLIYYGDVEKFLNSLGINPEGKEYDTQKVWHTYRHLLAREISKLVNAQVYA